MPVTWRHHRHPIPSPAPVIVTRRWTPGHYVALSDAQMGTRPGDYNPTGILNPGVRSNTGPVAKGVKALMLRYHLNELDNGDGTFNWSRPDAEIAQCQAFPADTDGSGSKGVQLFMLLVDRTFTGTNLATPFALSNVHVSGSAGQFTCNAASTTLTGISGGDATMVVYVTGTNTGTGSITGYPGISRYRISATNGSTTFTLQTLDQNALTTSSGTMTGLTFTVLDIENPLPPDLQTPKMYAEVIGVGWQVWRWSPTVLDRFDTLVKAIGSRYDSNLYFGGIATQETSTGGANGGTGVDAYTSLNFVNGLKAESNSIAGALQYGRGMHYTNFINGPYTDPTLNSETKCLEAYATTAQANGAVWGGPDLVVGGSILTRCYPTYKKVQDGTSPIAAKGPTFCSCQNPEWTDTSPADAYPATTMQDRFDFGTGVAKNYGGGPTTPDTDLSIIVWDYHTAGGGTSGSPSFNPQGVNIFAANPAPFGPYTP